MGKRNENKPVLSTWWGIRSAGFISVFVLYRLYEKVMDVLLLPEEDELITVFAYALCVLGFSAAAFVELGGVGEPWIHKPLNCYLLYAALAVVFVIFLLGTGLLIGAIFTTATCCLHDIRQSDWYLGLSFGAVCSLALGCAVSSAFIKRPLVGNCNKNKKVR